jgi:hypothetical protein
MTKVLACVAAAALLVLGFSLESNAQDQKGHRHGIAVKAFAKQTTLPRSGDPDTAGVKGVTAICPKNYRAVGGGHDSNRIAYVPESKLQFDRYTVIAVNRVNSAGVLEAEVGCVPGQTKFSPPNPAKRSADFRSRVALYREQARRSH